MEFVIERLDPMGQGVCKGSVGNKEIVTFIPKALPGEKIRASIVGSRRGVQFGRLEEVVEPSSQRIAPECVHFGNCPGCDYLHVDYPIEISYKTAALAYLLRRLPIGEVKIESIPSDTRLGYRNRIQLHYRHKYIGLVDSDRDQILEIPHCKILSPGVKSAMDELYGDKSSIFDHGKSGHVELYERIPGEVKRRWNEDYASGGFSQVNRYANDRLRSWLESYAKEKQLGSVLDLFSGAGNLSDAMLPEIQSRQLIDVFPDPDPYPEGYLQIDLYDPSALKIYLGRAINKKIDCLLLDPPRRGFHFLSHWINEINPKHLVYVSCNPASLSRDLEELVVSDKKKKYRFENIVLIDMFPGTRHFETVVTMTKS